MLTTTLDGLWVLQVLSGIEVLAPELGLRHHLPSAESPLTALTHPVTGELRSAGVIDDAGVVDPTIVEWLTVLSRRDVALLIQVNTPEDGGEPERISIARFGRWWVTLQRCGFRVRLSGTGVATDEPSAVRLVSAHIERLLGTMPSAALKPVTIDVAELLGGVRDAPGLRGFLMDRRLDGDQVSALMMAADHERSAQASVVAIQAGPAHTHISTEVVTIIDTPQGRLLSEHVTREARSWLIVSPGTPGNIASAVVALMRNLPAGDEWFSYRKAI